MHINTIKKEMKAYRDFYGFDLINSDEIDTCKTKKDLKKMIDEHEVHLEMMLADAFSHIRHFKNKTGLDQIF